MSRLSGKIAAKRTRSAIRRILREGSVVRRGGGRGSVAAHIFYVSSFAAALLKSLWRTVATHTFGDGCGPPRCGALHNSRGPTRRLSRSRTQARRSLYGRHASSSNKARLPTFWRCCCARSGLAARNWAWLPRLFRHLFRRLQQYNPRSRSRQNVAHHYDLDGRLYSLFLDGDRQYSCAYFEIPDQSLDDAQLAKKRHLGGQADARRPAAKCSTSAAAGAGLRSISPK